nr:uncharacterized protein LOC131750367 [Kogia breviceps]
MVERQDPVLSQEKAILKEEQPDFHKDIYPLLTAAFSDVADKVIVVEVQDLLLENKFQHPSITKDPGGNAATEESSKEPSLISWEQTVSPPISLRGLGMPLTAHGTCSPPSLFSFSRIFHSCKVIVTIAPSATCLGSSEDHLREWLQESFMNSPLGQTSTGMKMSIGCSRQSTHSGVWGPGWDPRARQLLNLAQVFTPPSLFAHVTTEPAMVDGCLAEERSSDAFIIRQKIEQNCAQPMFAKPQESVSTFITFVTSAL